MGKSIVSVVRSTYEEAAQKLPLAIDLAGGMSITTNSKVIIKLNLCDARTPETGAITHPLFLDAVLKYLRENYSGLQIYVVESDSTVVLADEFIRWFGFVPLLKKWNATWVNLSREKTSTQHVNGLYLKDVEVPDLFNESFFITLPKLKTNPLSSITCCLKNQFGCLTVLDKSAFHPHLDRVIADANKVFHPDFCIVDGILCNGGIHGPAFGVPVQLGAIICGKDPVSVDAFGAKLIGFNPFFVGHIQKAAHTGVGSLKYSLRGDRCAANFSIGFLDRMEMSAIKLGVLLQARSLRKMRNDWRSK